MPKNPELRKVWEQPIADYRKSGQTQVNWCKENQWSIHQFKYWLRKIENPIKNQGKSTKWASVTLEDHSQTVENSLRIEISGISIEVKPGFDPAFLSEVVRTLKSTC